MNSYFIDILCHQSAIFEYGASPCDELCHDREQIVKIYFKNAPHGPAENGIVPRDSANIPIGDVHGISYNPDSARYWLKKSGLWRRQ